MQETKEERKKRLQRARWLRYKEKNPDAQKIASRKWRANNPGYKNPKAISTALIVDELKKQPCMDCGQIFPTVCMDFDHRDRSDKYNNVGTMVAHNYSMEKILAEIEKCDLICSNCHRIRTWGESRDKLRTFSKNSEVES